MLHNYVNLIMYTCATLPLFCTWFFSIHNILFWVLKFFMFLYFDFFLECYFAQTNYVKI